MKVWVTKYALTKGLFGIDADRRGEVWEEHCDKLAAEHNAEVAKLREEIFGLRVMAARLADENARLLKQNEDLRDMVDESCERCQERCPHRRPA